MSEEPAYFVHSTAIVEPGAVIGPGTKIWHHAHIRSGAVIGAGCVFGKNTFVDSGAIVGDRVKVQNNVSVYSGVTILDDVFVGPSAVFTNDRVPRAFNDHWVISPTSVGNGASVGANATIICGTTLGAYSMIAAGATVTHDVADHQLVVGVPARHFAWVCRCGEIVSRAEVAPEQLDCASCAEKGSDQ